MIGPAHNDRARALAGCALGALALVACETTPTQSAMRDGGAMQVSQSPSAPALAPGDLDPRLDTVFATMATDYFTNSPEAATFYNVDVAQAGGRQHLNRWDARGPAARAANRDVLDGMAESLRGVDPLGLTEAAATSRAALLSQMDAALAADAVVEYGGAKLGAYKVNFDVYPVTQLTGVVTELPNLMQAQQPVRNAEEAAAYVARLNGMAAAIDGAIAEMQADAAAGVIPPDFVLKKSLAIVQGLRDTPFDKNILYTSFAEKITESGTPGGAGLLNRAGAALEASVYPALDRLASALRAQALIAPHDAGIWRLPNGAALYEALIKLNADVDLSADEIHQIGLNEVARLHAEMSVRLDALGVAAGPIGARMSAFGADPRYVYPNTADGKARLLADVTMQVRQVEALLPGWFATLPRQGVEVRAVPTFSQDSAPGGYYDAPALDGSRPGIYWINLRDTASWPTWALKTLTYHEASPGHHLQVALSLEQEGVPQMRRMLGGTNAYVEGWALYTEQLAAEMGLYKDDPAGDLGRLQSELFRAVRLVVDTGMHAKQWSREQAISYMVAAGAAEPADAEIEIERYAAIPAQALGYKMGMVEILAMREQARAVLGADFDIARFHDAVLVGGGMPIGVLRTRIDSWVAQERARLAAPPPTPQPGADPAPAPEAMPGEAS